MSSSSLVRGLDGLMTLSRREGVDIRPTLLRVLTDLYVQAPSHTAEEERQFTELATRLIEAVDDATRAAVRARLSLYPNTPAAIARLLAVPPAAAMAPPAPGIPPHERPAEATPRSVALALNPRDAAELNEMFFAADARERALILHSLDDAPLKPAAAIEGRRAIRSRENLEQAAFVGDREAFLAELSSLLILPARIAERIVDDAGGEALAAALKAAGLADYAFQRVLLFLDHERGCDVMRVYRLARLYDVIGRRAALIMLSAFRGAPVAEARAKYRPALHDDERQRARMAAATRVTPSSAPESAVRRGLRSR